MECGIFYDNGKVIKHVHILNFGELTLSGSRLFEYYSNEEDVKKLFEYIWIEHIPKPYELNAVQNYKGKGINFLTYEDVLEFINPKETDVFHYYYFKDKQWYYTFVPKKIEGFGLVWNELSYELSTINDKF